MKMKLILSILLISSLGLLSSCKKDEDSPKTKTEMLTGTSCWKLVKSELKNETGVYVDNTEILMMHVSWMIVQNSQQMENLSQRTMA